MRSIKLLLLLFLITSSFAAQPDSQTHPFSIHDMLAMERISDPQVSPDNRQIVFVLRKTDLEQNKSTADLWLVNIDGTSLRRLTSHPENDSNPRWSPDGKTIWFLSSRSDSSQVWYINIDGGEAEQFSNLPLDIGNLIVSPDGKFIAFTMEVFPDCDTIECTKNRLDEIENRKVSGRIYDRIFIRHWDTWKDGRRSHVFVMPTSDDQSQPIDLMQTMDADTPSKPFGGPDEITFTPDSKQIIFTARDAGRQEPWSTDFDLYRVPVDGSKPPECITDDNQAWDTNPVFSPDGKTLAYLAMSRPGYESDRFRIVLMSWPDLEKRILTENWDRSPSSISWSLDNKTIYAPANNLGQKSLFALDVDTAKVNTIVIDGRVNSPTAVNDRIIYGLNNLKSPTQLYSVKQDGSDVQAITNINAEKLASVRMGDYEQFTFPGWNQERVYCYIVRPIDFNPQQKYPVAFLIHGGPQGSFSNSFHYRWNPQVYAGVGYAVVMVDFHGSTGYGQAFTDSIRG
ncbi:MAG: S9 family peptidase, partial [Planctomycetota bacterium]